MMKEPGVAVGRASCREVSYAPVPARGADAGRLFAPVRVVLAGLAVAAALAGCAGSSPAVRLHALNVVLPTVTNAYAGPPVAVRTVSMPPGTDRIEMSRDIGPGQFVVREFDQWSAPLGSLVRQVLAEDLASRLGAAAVVVPGGEWPVSRLELSVDILSYRVVNGVAVVTLNWGLRPTAAPSRSDGPGRTDMRNALRLETRLTADAAASTAEAWSALTGQLADQVAAALSGPRPAGAP